MLFFLRCCLAIVCVVCCLHPRSLAPQSGFLEWCGYDKFGRATLWARAAKHFPDEKLWEQTKKYIIFKMEQGIRLTEAKGNEQIVVLYDREHVRTVCTGFVFFFFCFVCVARVSAGGGGGWR